MTVQRHSWAGQAGRDRTGPIGRLPGARCGRRAALVWRHPFSQWPGSRCCEPAEKGSGRNWLRLTHLFLPLPPDIGKGAHWPPRRQEPLQARPARRIKRPGRQTPYPGGRPDDGRLLGIRLPTAGGRAASAARSSLVRVKATPHRVRVAVERRLRVKGLVRCNGPKGAQDGGSAAP